MADDALLRPSLDGIEVREQESRIDDPRDLDADVVAVCAGPLALSAPV